MRVLLVEDDQSVADYIVKGLIESGFEVDHLADGAAGLAQADNTQYSVVILDRMLPNTDGLTILKAMRAAENPTPVLVLSALGEVSDKVEGLRAGGDDYLAKPFAFSELLARLEALVRRGDGAGPQTRLQVADIEMDLLTHDVTRAGKKITLQPREFRLLEYLMKHESQVVTRTMLLENVWDYHFDPQTNVIDVHISRLRQKIDKDFAQPLLNTVRGVGYMLNAPE